MKWLNKLGTLSFFLSSLLVFGQSDCSKLFYAYNSDYDKQNYEAAFPKWQKSFEKLFDCKDFKYFDNILPNGEEMAEALIEQKQTKADSMKYGKVLGDIMAARAKINPQEKLYWQGEEIYQKESYGLLTKEQAYAAYKDLVGKASAANAELSAGAVINYFYAGSHMYNSQQIDFGEFMQLYFDDRKVIEANTESRSRKYGMLIEKEDSLFELEPPKKLTKEEEAKKEELQEFADYFAQIQDGLDGTFAAYVTCDNIGPFYLKELQDKPALKDSISWLESAYGNLDAQQCQDAEAFSTVYNNIINHPKYDSIRKANEARLANSKGKQGGGGARSSSCPTYNAGITAYKKGSYSSAISNLTSALDCFSDGKTKGILAYYIADSYKKTGQKSKALSWFRKSANFRPGWGSPYIGIAGIYGDKNTINSCGSNVVQKKAGYLVAADYIFKACRVDPSTCKKYAPTKRGYEANGPTAAEVFNAGMKKGQRVAVTCYGGATTRLR